MIHGRRAKVAIFGLVLATVAGARVGALVNQRRIENKAYGQYTLRQILHKSSTLNGAINPAADSGFLTGMPLDAGGFGKCDMRLWVVDSNTQADTATTHFIWNADSGELMIASRDVHSTQVNKGSLRISKDEAIRKTGSWLVTLGIAAEDSGWRHDAPYFYGCGWRVMWTAYQHRTMVCVDAKHGGLLLLNNFIFTPRFGHAKRTN